MSLLEVRNLCTSFFIPAGEVKSVNGISFDVDKGKVLGIVGESGSGKSVTAYSIMQILAHPGKIVSGSIKLNGEELVGKSEKELSKIRGNKISIIFQDPMTSLNPVYTIGNQLVEAIRLHTNRTKEEAKERAIEMLSLVGVNDPKRRMKQYPFEFSGGMLQRVMIAMALVCEPDILIADEPTTALDVTIQAQILELLKNIQKELGMAIIIITHDLGVVAQICDEVDVMYAGRIVERATVDELFYNPQHEYTKGLIKSIPKVTSEKERLIPIKGNPVDVFSLPKGCSFSPRCDACMKICMEKYPPEVTVFDTHRASCFNFIKSLYDDNKITKEELSEYMYVESTIVENETLNEEAVDSKILDEAKEATE